MTSGEGAAITRVYGTIRVGGQVIWATDFETEHVSSSAGGLGKGGGSSAQANSTSQVRYYANFAVAVCEGPVDRIGRVWADGQELSLSLFTYRVYRGDEDQLADALIVSREGAAAKSNPSLAPRMDMDACQFTNNGGLEVPDGEFMVGESICEGDSGGPALDTDTGAIIGVVSRGGNGQVSQTNPSAGCVGVDTINLYTETTPFKDLIMQAFQSAGAEPWVEGGPDPRLAKFGATCDGNAACRSNICLTDKKTCSQSCADGSKCPSGYECNGSKICAVPAPASSGCAAQSET